MLKFNSAAKEYKCYVRNQNVKNNFHQALNMNHNILTISTQQYNNQCTPCHAAKLSGSCVV